MGLPSSGAVTKVEDWGLKQQTLLLTALEVGGPGSRHQQTGVWRGPASWLTDGRAAVSLCPAQQREIVSRVSSSKGTVHEASTLRTSQRPHLLMPHVWGRTSKQAFGGDGPWQAVTGPT